VGPSGAEAGEGLRNALRPALRRAPLTPAARRRLSGRATRRAVWVFLAHGPLTAKALVYEGWKSLDFLGFSRPNRDFSMGYADFSLKEISRALLPTTAASAGWARAFSACVSAGLFIVEVNPFSDFLQLIAVEARSAW
jgi:hypothetical protein